MEKIAIYWQVAKDEFVARKFLINAMRRAVSDEDSFLYFYNYLGYSFPADYPEAYVDLARKFDVNLISLNATAAFAFKIQSKEGQAYREAKNRHFESFFF